MKIISLNFFVFSIHHGIVFKHFHFEYHFFIFVFYSFMGKSEDF